jgi:small-conductance mechanosensitive channel
MQSILDIVFLGNQARVWLRAGVVFVALFFALTIARTFLLNRLVRVAARTATDLDDLVVGVLESTSPVFLFLVSARVATSALDLTPTADKARVYLFGAIVFWQAVRWANALIAFGARRYTERMTNNDAVTRSTARALVFVVRLVVYSAVLVIVLENMQVKITALITGLGIGGVAVALAAQNVLGDLFAALAIITDRPFMIGDFIVSGTEMGTIEDIGWKTTRLLSLSGEQIIMANSNLLSSRVRNYRTMKERRVVFAFGVTYDTGSEKLAAIPPIVKDVIQSVPKTRFDRCHFMNYGESSLDFETVYYFLGPDYNQHMDAQQSILLELYRRCEAHDISFAFPTRTVYVERGASMARRADAPQNPSVYGANSQSGG